MKNKSILCLWYERRDIRYENDKMREENKQIDRDRRALFGEIVCGVLVGIFFVSICVQTVFHSLKASVVNVDDIWGKGDGFIGEVGE
jgi:hypothetical protein